MLFGCQSFQEHLIDEPLNFKMAAEISWDFQS